MPRMLRWAVLAGALATSMLSTAHEGGKHVKGTVHEITSDRIVVTEPDGNDVAFVLTPDTTFERGKARSRREDVKVGERVVVHGQHADNHEIATTVKLAGAGRGR